MSLKPKFASEAELAKQIVEWLTREQWEVYQEVNVGMAGGTCDIVAVRGAVTWAIECKLNVNIEVIGQADRWVHRASLASIATPYKYMGGAADAVVRKLLSKLGVGWLTAQPGNLDRNHEWVQPRFTRPRNDIREHLHEAQKTMCAAGGNRGGYYSPFKATCREVRLVVEGRPGLTMRELVSSITHHYASDASARGCLVRCIQDGIVDGVKAVKDGGKLLIYPTTA